MRRVLTMSVVIIILSSSVAWSFDGERRGFVLGGGLGAATTNIEVKGEPPYDDEAAVGAHVLIGYGWNELNMLVVEANLSAYEPDNSLLTVTVGFGGISWYHYFTPDNKSFFTVVGLGAMNYDIHVDDPSGDYDKSADPGGGLLLGAGYRFARHFQVAMYLSAGETSVSPNPSLDFEHVNVSVLVSAIAF